MWNRMFARVNDVSSLAHRARVFAPAAQEAAPVSLASTPVEPDVTRDLYERAECIVESGCFDEADAAAMRHVLARSRDADAPSFF